MCVQCARLAHVASVVQGLYYMAPICTAWMFGLATFLELPSAMSKGHLVLVQQHAPMFILAMVLGLCTLPRTAPREPSSCSVASECAIRLQALQ